MTGFVYDTGALIAAQRGDRRMWAIHQRALDRDARPLAPAGIVAEAWRGNDRNLSRILAGCDVVPLGLPSARATGELLSRVRRAAGVVDASVVETAARFQRAVLTSDRDDIAALMAAVPVKLDIVAL